MNRIWYGGDYNPEQWPRDVWDEDVELMRRAGVTVITLGVFSWAKLEPEDGRFDFGWLDDIIDRLHSAGIRVDLATATASPPAWLALKHPETLPVTADGVRLGTGSRQQYSPSSRTYKRYAGRLVRALAERYGSHPALEAWHVNNELACHTRHDYSDESAAEFRNWLQRRYGDIETLNQAWGTAFWSQNYSSFAEVMPPRAMPTFPNPTQRLDFDRFTSDAWLGVYRAEVAILREITPDVPITTNFMGFFIGADYWSWADELDFISDDHYADPADPAAAAYAAMTRDLMRSLGRGRPWILMEQATSAVNWRTRNAAIPAGWHRALSLQAVARGADGIMQFQWRQSRAGAEKFHSAMVPHAGTDTRIFRETVKLGQELAGLADLVEARVDARVAILFDWDSWWAHEQDASPARTNYVAEVFRWYRELWDYGVLTDFVRAGEPLDDYDVVIAPAVLVLSEESRAVLAEFVHTGGHLLATYLTGVLDENLHAVLGGYPGPALRDILGVWIEEFAPPAAPSMSLGDVPNLEIDGLAAGVATGWGEVVRLDGAEVRSWFRGGILDGLPAITRHAAGSGIAWYAATAPANAAALMRELLDGASIPFESDLPIGVEWVTRGERTFVINHTDEWKWVDGVHLEPFGASVSQPPVRCSHSDER
ncbi:beta-galactosidase [Microbacterium sp. X-17]|uniref:beta-galactosidase n=1 Tax=Microbacterium sp. X-17 TaxID=3144404 RepID=UPI0031F59D0D